MHKERKSKQIKSCKNDANRETNKRKLKHVEIIYVTKNKEKQFRKLILNQN